MLVYSLAPRSLQTLTFGMAAILVAYAAYYAVDASWFVVAGATICAVGLLVLGIVTRLSGRHPAAGFVIGAIGAINAGAITGIVGLSVDGAVWLAPLVFVNFLLGGVHAGVAITVVTVTAIVVLGGFYAHPDLVLNILGAVGLSLMMAAAYAGAMRAHFSRLYAEAHHDPLTGLLNRRAFEGALEQRLAGATGPVSVVFLDLDHFKQLNDRFGHPAGDRVLRRFAQVAASQLRRSDALYRHGGEEFMVLLDASADDSLRVADKLRRAVALEQFRADFDLTVSAGIAEAEPGDDARTVVRNADRALYAAKAAGRNRCAVAGDEDAVHVEQLAGVGATE